MPKKIKLTIKAEELRKKMNLQNGKDGLDGKDGKSIVGPKGDKGASGKDAVVDIDQIVATSTTRAVERVLPTIPTLSQVADNVLLGSEKLARSLETLTGKKRLDESAIKGLEKFKTTKDFDFAFGVLDQRTQFLINKNTSVDLSAYSTKSQADTYYYPLSANPAGYLTSSDLSAYVPYQGATGDVNLGTHGIDAGYSRYSFYDGVNHIYTVGYLGNNFYGGAFHYDDDVLNTHQLDVTLAGTDGNGKFYAGYFKDINNNTVYLSDETYAINATGNTNLNGDLYTVLGKKVGFGTASPAGIFEVSTDTGGIYPFYLTAYSDSIPIPGFQGRSARGSHTTPTATQNGDYLFAIGSKGYNATTGFGGDSSAIIEMTATENYTSTANGSQISFKVTPNTTVSQRRAMLLNNAGVLYTYYGQNITGDVVSTGNFDVYTGMFSARATSQFIGVAKFTTNVGIGLGGNAPLELLHISKTSSGFNRAIKLQGANSSAGDGTYIEFSSSSLDGYGARIGGIRTGSGTGANSIIFQTGTNSQGTRMTIKDTGVINIAGVPTSTAGLVTGDIWCDTTGGLNILKVI